MPEAGSRNLVAFAALGLALGYGFGVLFWSVGYLWNVLVLLVIVIILAEALKDRAERALSLTCFALTIVGFVLAALPHL